MPISHTCLFQEYNECDLSGCSSDFDGCQDSSSLGLGGCSSLEVSCATSSSACCSSIDISCQSGSLRSHYSSVGSDVGALPDSSVSLGRSVETCSPIPTDMKLILFTIALLLFSMMLFSLLCFVSTNIPMVGSIHDNLKSVLLIMGSTVGIFCSIFILASISYYDARHSECKNNIA
ncbi:MULTISPECIES: hypothetical protein [Candidatus Ichthyocystis]|uniref:Putative membrane protein n=1 Tax=Candidatus Ichthyocystis hellenicum TaxID=1561003 RepID=A0A0S4M588_9BURK|nr:MULTISPECIES: hypothetical protein [Ichthyocystis]CUT18066.1 putative membrane protein [Candidatus Ichthyocystis hellenicum]